MPIDGSVAAKIGRYRWRICSLLFLATTLNYMDRQILGLLAPILQVKIGWNEIQYGYIVTAFQGAYALGLLFMGGLIDRVGTRIGYSIAIGIWSLAAMSHSLVRTAFGFGVARFALGLGESGNFPAAIKTVSEWFPRKERALATGIFNSGSNLGAIVAPLAVPWVAIHYGWPYAFLFTGVFSAIWIILWWTTYRRPAEHERLSKEELAYICSDPPAPVTKIPWLRLLPHRQTWAFILGKFLTDPVWWFYLYWIPKFLNEKHGLTLNKLGLPLVFIYLMADVGSIGGGWLSGAFLKHGWSENRARKTAMFVCALGTVPMIFASGVSGTWAAVGLLGLASAAHQGWSANIFTLVSDMFPQRAVASVVGIGGFGGAVGGMLIATFTGFLLQATGSYRGVFLIAGSAYLIALLVIHLLAPRLEPAAIE
ncbi:MAG TPA: MFS transporter [Terriglobales bacterium]|nr:MFS transporter [Terriglobales bacterium]